MCLCARHGELLCCEPRGLGSKTLHASVICAKTVECHPVLDQYLEGTPNLNHDSVFQEGYAEQLSIRAGEVLVTELQLCQMQVCLCTVLANTAFPSMQATSWRLLLFSAAS